MVLPAVSKRAAVGEELPDNEKKFRRARSSKGDVVSVEHPTNSAAEPDHPPCGEFADVCQQPAEAGSNDPEVLRAALIREARERGRAECRANMQTEIVNLALDLLVREPDVDGFFGGLTKMMVEESESQTCGVWLIDESGERGELWMVYVKDRLYTPRTDDWDAHHGVDEVKRLGCASLEQHLFDYRPGWNETIEYAADDPRLPEAFRVFARRMNSAALVATPMSLGNRTLGWMTMSVAGPLDRQNQWWRIALLEAVARQAALALHHNRLIDLNRREERRKAILEERNRLARDIHDNLAQGFAAILMQLQAAQRESGATAPAAAAANIEIAIDLARSHLTEARRSVGALRPNVGPGEDIATALKRLAEMGQRTAKTPIDVVIDELPRLGDAVEREIIGIAQEALTNAVRHSRARAHHAARLAGAGRRLAAVGRRQRPRHRPRPLDLRFRSDQHARARRPHWGVADDRHRTPQRHRGRARLGTILAANAGA